MQCQAWQQVQVFVKDRVIMPCVEKEDQQVDNAFSIRFEFQVVPTRSLIVDRWRLD